MMRKASPGRRSWADMTDDQEVEDERRARGEEDGSLMSVNARGSRTTTFDDVMVRRGSVEEFPQWH